MGHSYYTVYSDLIDQEYFREGRDGAFEQPERPQESKIAPHLDLVPKVCPGPGYSKAIAEESIRERYDVIQKLIPVTLRRLRKQKDFLDVVTYLRGRGWKDWHILSALFTSVMNFRCAQRFGSHPTHQQVLNHMKQFTSEPETRRAKVVPLSVLTAKALEFSRRGNLHPVLQSWGFETHHPAFTPDIIEEFLSSRFGYWDDDIPHESIFGV
jgi:hypothetical protein